MNKKQKNTSSIESKKILYSDVNFGDDNNRIDDKLQNSFLLSRLMDRIHIAEATGNSIEFENNVMTLKGYLHPYWKDDDKFLNQIRDIEKINKELERKIEYAKKISKGPSIVNPNLYLEQIIKKLTYDARIIRTRILREAIQDLLYRKGALMQETTDYEDSDPEDFEDDDITYVD